MHRKRTFWSRHNAATFVFDLEATRAPSDTASIDPDAPPGITINDLRHLFAYNPESGRLTWRVARPGIEPGQDAGTLVGRYRVLSVNGVKVSASRAVMAMTTGQWPKDRVRFSNGDPTDLSMANLTGRKIVERPREYHARRELRRVNKAVYAHIDANPDLKRQFYHQSDHQQQQRLINEVRNYLRSTKPQHFPTEHLLPRGRPRTADPMTRMAQEAAKQQRRRLKRRLKNAGA